MLPAGGRAKKDVMYVSFDLVECWMDVVDERSVPNQSSLKVAAEVGPWYGRSDGRDEVRVRLGDSLTVFFFKSVLRAGHCRAGY